MGAEMKDRPRWIRFFGTTLLLIAAGCASLPSDYPIPPPSMALEADPSTSLGSHVADFVGRHGEGVSGFSAIDANGDALTWRLALVDSAERSLDLLYYLWYDDLGGLLLLEHVIKAADRGVRVRIVVDDTLFLKGKESLAALSAHPEIEIRVFNPWASRGARRVVETAARAKSLNRRMHNKLLVADSQMAILGGRNIGDHYFGLHHRYNFHDLDVVVIGDTAADSTEIFDHFWNSDRVIPATAFVKEVSWNTIEERREEELKRLQNTDELTGFPLGRRDWSNDLSVLVQGMSPGTATLEYDRLVPGPEEFSQDAAVGLAEIVESAKDDVLILNAYIIPGEWAMETFRSLGDRGVRVRMLTNSLASNDVPAVTAKYKKYRRPLLDAGAELYEFRAHPKIQPGVVDTDPVTAEFAGFHTKAAVVDRKLVYIGSLNLDPRSIKLNTEMGMIVSSPEFAAEVASIAERDMSSANSWRVGLDEDGKLFWKSGAGTVTRQPAESTWQRIQAWFFKIFPESQL